MVRSPPYIKSDKIVLVTLHQQHSRWTDREVYYTNGKTVIFNGKYYRREHLFDKIEFHWIDWRPILTWFNMFSDVRLGISLVLTNIMSRDLMNMIEEYLFDWKPRDEYQYHEYHAGHSRLFLLYQPFNTSNISLYLTGSINT